MQLHVHSQIAHICRTQLDGKWRAPDSLGYQEHVAAVGSIVAAHFEEALTRRFGVRWAARDANGRPPAPLGYQEHGAAVGSIVAAHFEEPLTRRFGVRWAARDDGRG